MTSGHRCKTGQAITKKIYRRFDGDEQFATVQ